VIAKTGQIEVSQYINKNPVFKTAPQEYWNTKIVWDTSL